MFSFSATAPYTVTPGPRTSTAIVNSIAFNGSDCTDAYIGGKFTSVNGTAVKNIAEIDTTTGAVVPGFGHSATAQVETLLGVNGHLLVGGYFTTINGSSADPYMTSLDPTTGKDDGFLHLNISGYYHYSSVISNATRVYNQQLSHGGTLDLVRATSPRSAGAPAADLHAEPGHQPGHGDRLDVTGVGRQQGELSRQPGGYPYQCATVEPFYIQAAAWSPDDSTIYIATTGYHPNGCPAGSNPRNGLCDAAAAFPATPGRRCCTSGSTTPAATRLLGGGRRQHRLLRRPRALVDEPERLRRAGPGRDPRSRHGGPVADRLAR